MFSGMKTTLREMQLVNISGIHVKKSQKIRYETDNKRPYL